MIACCTFDVDLLGPTFDRHPELSVDVEGVHAGRSVPLRVIFWGEGVPATELESTLRSDRTVTAAEVLSRVSNRTLYRSTHPPELQTVAAYDAAIEHDVLAFTATSDGDGWNLRLAIPDRDALSAFCRQCERHGIDVSVVSIRDRDATTLENEFGLTTAQRELLALAWSRGYFSIPRKTSLSALATELDITQQAASERLRRGLWNLLSNTVCENDTNCGCRQQ